ncbi:MAG TPA: transglutaminase domain-containing protein [Anaeromyxobacteraceae bacterium]|nr:transglutaminase domain-containing protein [Anaeromyxobacteraceae bacterium]
MKGLVLLLALLGLPESGARRYRMEIAGAAVGVAELAIACDPAGCRARFETVTRVPEAAGGGRSRHRILVASDRVGIVREAQVGGDGDLRPAPGTGAVASMLAEVLLAAAPEGQRSCLEVVDVETGRTGRACATRRGRWFEGEVLREPVRFRPGRDGLPDEVVLAGQDTRFLADAAAAVPERAPRMLGALVPAPPGAEEERSLRFCGVAAEDEDPEPPPPGIPRSFPEEGSCREKTAAWLAEARAFGLAGRHAVGVAWDGRNFVWHEWAELNVGGRWVAVDPSFRQVPAQGPRFTLARFADGDDAARVDAGRRVLACWGKARVQVAR